jgi:hypothetical protein
MRPFGSLLFGARSLPNMGDLPALPGWQSRFDISRSPSKKLQNVSLQAREEKFPDEQV